MRDQKLRWKPLDLNLEEYQWVLETSLGWGWFDN